MVVTDWDFILKVDSVFFFHMCLYYKNQWAEGCLSCYGFADGWVRKESTSDKDVSGWGRQRNQGTSLEPERGLKMSILPRLKRLTAFSCTGEWATLSSSGLWGIFQALWMTEIFFSARLGKQADSRIPYSSVVFIQNPCPELATCFSSTD